MGEILEAAAGWVAGAQLAGGVSVIPLRHRDKRPDCAILIALGMVGPDGRAMWEPYQKRLPTIDELVKWFATDWRNYGVVTGWQGLTVLDFDAEGAYKTWCEWAAPELRETFTVKTARGAHVYFQVAEKVAKQDLATVEIKAHGAYVVGPGSTHPSGAIYTPVDPGTPIVRAARLAELVPASEFVKDDIPHTRPSPVQVAQMPARNDPWEAIVQPVEKGRKGEVAEIKAILRVEDLVQGAHPSGHGYLMARCPLHDDAHDSLSIDPVAGTWSCQSGCGRGDAIDLYGKMAHISNREAIAQLRKLLPSGGVS